MLVNSHEKCIFSAEVASIADYYCSNAQNKQKDARSISFIWHWLANWKITDYFCDYRDEMRRRIDALVLLVCDRFVSWFSLIVGENFKEVSSSFCEKFEGSVASQEFERIRLSVFRISKVFKITESICVKKLNLMTGKGSNFWVNTVMLREETRDNLMMSLFCFAFLRFTIIYNYIKWSIWSHRFN